MERGIFLDTNQLLGFEMLNSSERNQAVAKHDSDDAFNKIGEIPPPNAENLSKVGEIQPAKITESLCKIGEVLSKVGTEVG